MENELKDTSQALACGHVPLSVKGVHTILKGMLQSSKNKEGDDDSKISNDLVRAVQLGATLWGSEEAEPHFLAALQQNLLAQWIRHLTSHHLHLQQKI